MLVKRIYDAADEAQAKYPNVEILNAPYLDDHPLVIETLLDRIREMLVGQNLMNCAMCKYREQVLGFEAEIGLRQESHHHHVEGIGGGLENCPCGGDCDSSCRDEAFCRKHGLPWTPLHTHHHPHPHVQPHALLRVATPTPSLPVWGREARPQMPVLPSPMRGGAGGGGGPRTQEIDHDHHHHPYPHAKHPHGPVTLPKIPGKLAREDRE